MGRYAVRGKRVRKSSVSVTLRLFYGAVLVIVCLLLCLWICLFVGQFVAGFASYIVSALLQHDVIGWVCVATKMLWMLRSIISSSIVDVQMMFMFVCFVPRFMMLLWRFQLAIVVLMFLFSLRSQRFLAMWAFVFVCLFVHVLLKVVCCA